MRRGFRRWGRRSEARVSCDRGRDCMTLGAGDYELADLEQRVILAAKMTEHLVLHSATHLCCRSLKFTTVDHRKLGTFAFQRGVMVASRSQLGPPA